MQPPSWNAFYRATPPEKLPWHSGAPDPELIELVRRERVKRCRTLEIGCGQGTETAFLALAGFRISSVDIAPAAIRRARKLAKLLGAKVDLRVGSALWLPFPNRTFRFVVDRGCMHCLAEADRPRWVAEVARVTKPGAALFLRTFSDKAHSGYGPHCFTRRELLDLLEGPFRILSLVRYPALGSGGPPAEPLWALLAKRR